MNKIDKAIYEALTFLSDKTVDGVLKMKKENSDYHKYLPQQLEDALHVVGYISFNKSGANSRESAVTLKGIEELRILEDIKIKEKSIYISYLALFISALAFVKSMGWI